MDLIAHTNDSATRSQPTPNPAYFVQVSCAEGMWIAECDALGLVTEAATYEQLTARVWCVAADLMHDNMPDVPFDTVHMIFQHHEFASSQGLAH